MVTAAALSGRALGQLKEVLEEMERDWLNPPPAMTTLNLSGNHAPEPETRPARDRVASAENSDGSLKLSSGERRSRPP